MIKMSIGRPVAVSMAYLGVAVLGIAAWRNIPIELLPDTQLPQLSVVADWPGASPEVTEAFLTSPLEAAIQQVRGVEEISSTSSHSSNTGQGRAEITVRFDRDTDMDFARLELSENLIALDDELPEGASTPRVEQYVPREFRDQDQEFLSYTVTGPYTLEALRTHIDDVIIPELLQVEGVANVTARGGRARALQVELDPDELRSLGLDINAIRRQIMNLEYVSEAGIISDAGRLRTLAVRQRVGTAGDVRDMVVSGVGRLVRLGDIATISDTFEEPRMYYRIDGLPAVSFEVEKEAGTNVVDVSERAKARLAEIAHLNPPGVRLILDNDEAEEVKNQLTDLRTRALIAAVVVFCVLLLFLRSFRSAGIIFATIAFSILISLNLIYFGGLTLNLLTLMGLALGFGLIVDNAIVVLENIYRRRNTGEEAGPAAAIGAREVVLPIVASTLTTLIVFIPFVYLQGEMRVYYVPLAIVVGMSLLASLFVAFTFIPALASKILGKMKTVGGDGGRPFYVRLYAGLVGFTVGHPWVTVVLATASFGGSYYLFDKHVNRGVLWGGFGESTYIAIQITQPAGAELERTDELVRFFEERLAAMPEIERFTTQVLPQFAGIRVTFPDSLENTQIPPTIKEQIMAYSHLFGGAEVRVYGYGPSFYGGGGSAPNYTIEVRGYNYQQTREIAESLKDRLERFSRVRDVNTNSGGNWWQNERAVEYAVEMDRARLAAHNLTARDVVFQVQASVAGRDGQGRLRVGGEELLFDVKFSGSREMNVLELSDLLLRNQDGVSNVRLGDVAEINQREVLSQIDRSNQQYQRFVRYEFRGPAKLGDRVRDAVIEATALPQGYEIIGSREWSWDDDEQKQIYALLAVSLVLIYMVTAALFESIKLPLVVLLTVPMALIGVFMMFFFTEATFTREAWIGVIMMGGIVVNNAILLVDHINQKRRAAMVVLKEAIVNGTLERVRPILMTSATTIFGLLPLVVLSETADANIWNALGYALIGGLTASTLFVLTVTPALYTISEARREKRKVAAALRMESSTA